MKIVLIAAVGKNNEIGKNGEMCFELPNDLSFFREITMGHKVVIGRKTYESLKKSLAGRDCYVITNRPLKNNWAKPIMGLHWLVASEDEKVFIIGGGNVFKQFIDRADKIILTKVDAEDKEADTFFPEIGEEWVGKIIKSGVDNGYNYIREEFRRL